MGPLLFRICSWLLQIGFEPLTNGMNIRYLTARPIVLCQYLNLRFQMTIYFFFIYISYRKQRWEIKAWIISHCKHDSSSRWSRAGWCNNHPCRCFCRDCVKVKVNKTWCFHLLMINALFVWAHACGSELYCILFTSLTTYA